MITLSDEVKAMIELAEKRVAYREFQEWQAAQVMTMVFGGGYVPIPPIPKGYENYAKAWYINQMAVVGRELAGGWQNPADNHEKGRIPAL